MTSPRRPGSPPRRAGTAADLLVAATAAACRPERVPSVTELVRRAAPGSLDAIAGLAVAHRVDGCVHAALEDVARAGTAVDTVIDAAVLDLLAAGRRQVTTRHLMVRDVLRRLGAVLDGAGVPWLVFKGPVLTSALYCDPGMRRYSDLDVLVPPGRFADAIAAMEAHGYRNPVTWWAPQRHFRAGALAFGDGPIGIDLHWHVIYKLQDRRWYRIDPEAMFDRRTAVDIGGQRCATFDPVDTVFHLALHAAREGCRCLLWLEDLERSVTVWRPDLDELVRRSRAARCAPAIGIALARSKWALGTDVPDSTIRDLVGRVWPRVVRAVARFDDLGSTSQRLSPGALLTRETRMSPGRSVAWALRRTRDRVEERRIDHLLERRFDPATTSAAEVTRNDADRVAYLKLVGDWTADIE